MCSCSVLLLSFFHRVNKNKVFSPAITPFLPASTPVLAITPFIGLSRPSIRLSRPFPGLSRPFTDFHVPLSKPIHFTGFHARPGYHALVIRAITPKSRILFSGFHAAGSFPFPHRDPRAQGTKPLHSLLRPTFGCRHVLWLFPLGLPWLLVVISKNNFSAPSALARKSVKNARKQAKPCWHGCVWVCGGVWGGCVRGYNTRTHECAPHLTCMKMFIGLLLTCLVASRAGQHKIRDLSGRKRSIKDNQAHVSV